MAWLGCARQCKAQQGNPRQILTPPQRGPRAASRCDHAPKNLEGTKMITSMMLATTLMVTPVQFQWDPQGILRRADEQARWQQQQYQQRQMLQEQARHNAEMEQLQRDRYYQQLNQQLRDRQR
jgi:hypothetical protein